VNDTDASNLSRAKATAGLRSAIPHQLFIDGKFVDAQSGETLPTLNPHDNSPIVNVAMAGREDIDKAVAAAQRAFPRWRSTSAGDRGRILLRLADKIEENAEELARLESLDTGHPLRDSRTLDVPRTALCFRYFGGMADKFEGSVVPVETGFLNYTLHEPVGVVGQVVPWNFPLMFTSWKLAPALAAGNCVVMKPAELTPLTSLKIAELMGAAGVPEGVVNIVPGLGSVAGQYLADHPQVAKIAFTGSTATGRKIVQASAGNLKRVQLELGGKGANIVFADANIPAAVNGSAWAIFHNQGQACIAGARLVLHERIADEFLQRFIALAESIRLGNPFDPATEMGPLTSSQHRDRVLISSASRKRKEGKCSPAAERHGILRLPKAATSSQPSCAPRPIAIASRRRRCSARSWPCSPSPTTRRPSRSPTAPNTDSAAACGRRICHGHTGLPGRCVAEWCGSTVTSAHTLAHRSAVWGSPAMAGKWASRSCGNTRRSSRCG
jgi:acyl-CoA reductase-like NAD-dependent aldehyde dehydrogenase